MCILVTLVTIVIFVSTFLMNNRLAEMVGRDHDKVLRDIRNIISHLGEARIGESPNTQLGERIFPQSYFIDRCTPYIQHFR